ncbi:hypothetical protein ACFRCQ_17465 [Cytobacillus firmus]|uniref:hypothetical protein n=1 Tax=Cytobacillus firmus TaxID=1399 RepID=UPI0036A2CD0F
MIVRRVLPAQVISHSQFGYRKLPSSVQCECPKCSKPSHFTIKANYNHTSKSSILSHGNCSACKKESVFIMILNQADQSSDETILYIYDPNSAKELLTQLEKIKEVPGDLTRAYRSALNVSYSRDTVATAVMSKRVLESILKNFLGEEVKGQNLSKQFEQLPKHVDLAKPLQSLSQLVQPGSPFYEMLDLEKDIDQEMAALLMELLESLIEYLFVLPNKIEMLQQKLNQKLL